MLKNIKEITHFWRTLRGIENRVTGKTHEQSAEQTNAAMGAIKEADWLIEDGMGVLAEINSHGLPYPESINILKEVLYATDPDKKLFLMGKPRRDWRIVLEEIIEKRQEYIRKYERQKIFENALHYGLGVTKEIRKKEIEQELGNIDWAVQFLEKLSHKYQSEFPSQMASDLSKAKNRKRILLKELATMDKKANIVNINDKARVNLTAHGQEILRQFYLGSYGYESLISSHYVEGNTYDFQIWELMRVFGKHMDNGMKTIFEKNKIEVKEGI